MAREISREKVGNITNNSMEIVRTYYLYGNLKMEVEQTIFYFEDGRRDKWYKGLLYHNDTYLVMTTFFNTITELERACRKFFMSFHY